MAIQATLDLFSKSDKLILDDILVEEAEIKIDGEYRTLIVYGKHIELNRPACKSYPFYFLDENKRKFYEIILTLKEYNIPIKIIKYKCEEISGDILQLQREVDSDGSS